MADFDGGGFSAVDDFFGKSGNDGPRNKERTDDPSPTPPPPSGRGRLGVGALKRDVPVNGTQGIVSKRLLQVGKQKGDSAAVTDNDETIATLSSDDEDMGRTAIRSKDTDNSTEAPSKSKTKKKKKGKKQRQNEREAQEEGAETLDKLPLNSSPTQEETVTEPNSKKRKRRKVRSRQKNIYKDRREKKPDYLLPGKQNYQGRPLTAATRKKLNLDDEEPLRSSWDDAKTTNDVLQCAPLDADKTENLGAPKTDRKGNPSKKSKYKNLTL